MLVGTLQRIALQVEERDDTNELAYDPDDGLYDFEAEEKSGIEAILNYGTGWEGPEFTHEPQNGARVLLLSYGRYNEIKLIL